MSFFSTFEEIASGYPNRLFLRQGSLTLTYRQALLAVKEMSSQEASRVALLSNSLTSVIGWLAMEMQRVNGGRLSVDLVKSSGSTGKPKTFYVSSAAQEVTARAINREILGGGQIEELIILPLTHSSARGRLRAAVLRGATITLSDHPLTFSSIRVVLEGKSPYAMAITPSTFRYIQERTGQNFWSTFAGLTSLEFGSAPLRELEQALLLERAPDSVGLVMHFGLSEASRSFLRDIRSSNWNQIGCPMPHAEFRLNSEGELHISGPHIAEEVELEGHSRKLTEVPTGDICAYSEEGALILRGRKKNTINLGGSTIYIEALESQLSDELGESNIYVARVSHELLGEVPVFFAPVECHTSLREFWRKYLTPLRMSHKPRVLEAHDIPFLPSGKVDRQALNVLATDLLEK